MSFHDFYGWGIERPEAMTGRPFLLSKVCLSRKDAQDWILETYGDGPSREAALQRHRRAGIRAIRVRVSAYGGGAK